MNLIKKDVVYTNQDGQPFEFGIKSENKVDTEFSVNDEKYSSDKYASDVTSKATIKKSTMFFSSTNGNSEFHFCYPEEVDEFIELLKEWKEYTWFLDK